MATGSQSPRGMDPFCCHVTANRAMVKARRGTKRVAARAATAVNSCRVFSSSVSVYASKRCIGNSVQREGWAKGEAQMRRGRIYFGGVAILIGAGAECASGFCGRGRPGDQSGLSKGDETAGGYREWPASLSTANRSRARSGRRGRSAHFRSPACSLGWSYSWAVPRWRRRRPEKVGAKRHEHLIRWANTTGFLESKAPGFMPGAFVLAPVSEYLALTFAIR